MKGIVRVFLKPFLPLSKASKVFTVVILIVVGHQVFAEGSITIRNYPPHEYNAHVQNWAAVQDEFGFIYLGNWSGILQYNGVEWKRIKTANGSAIRSFGKSESGKVFAGGIGDFGYLNTQPDGTTSYVSLTPLLQENDKNFNDVWFITTVSDDTYFSTYNKLYRYSNQTITVWNSQNNISTCFVFNNQVYVYVINEGIKHVTNNSLEPVPNGEFFANVPFRKAIQYNDTSVIVFTHGMGLYLFDLGAKSSKSAEQVIRKFKTQADPIFHNNLAYNAIRLNDGNYAIVVISVGVIIISPNGELLHVINEDKGLFNNSVSGVYQDVENNLWVSLLNGASKVTINPQITHWGPKEGLRGMVNQVVRHNDKLFIAHFDGLSALSNEKLFKYPGLETPVFYFQKFIPNKKNAKPMLLAGTNFNGVIEISEQGFKTVIPSQSVIYSILQLRSNPSILIMGKAGGIEVAEYKNGTFHLMGSVEGINLTAFLLTEDDKGDLWVTDNSNQIVRITPSSNPLVPKMVKHFDQKDGVPLGPRVYSYNGKILITSFKGIYTYHEQSETFIPDFCFGDDFANGKILTTTLNLYPDSSYLIYGQKGTRFGIGIKHKTEDAYYWFDEPFATLPHKNTTFTLLDVDSTLWICSSEGLYRYSPHIRIASKRPIFPGVITRAITGSDTIANPFRHHSSQHANIDRLRVNYKNNSVEFFFTALSFYNEGTTLYRSYLEGFDKGWSHWSKDIKRTYTNLKEGDYTFRVKALNIYGYQSTEATFHFTVRPPWFRTIWAYLSYSITIIFIIWLIVKVNTQRLKAENAKLEKTVHERTVDLSEVNTQLEEQQAELEIRQEELQAQTEMLAATNRELEKLSIVARETDNAVIIMDENFNFEWINEGFTRFYGLNFNDLLHMGKNLTSASRYEKIKEVTQHCKESKKSVRYENFVTTNGKNLWVQTTLTPIIDFEGEIKKIIAIDTDITEIKQAEIAIMHQKEEIQVQNAKLREMDDFKQGLTSMIVHDLKNPLNQILNISKSIKPEEQVIRMQQSGKQMLNMVLNILDVRKYEEVKMALDLKEKPLAGAVQRAINQVLFLCDQKAIQITNNIDPSLSVWTEEDTLERMIVNLLTNAIKFSPTGERISLSSQITSNGMVRISVADKGEGIEEGKMHLVFQKFGQIVAKKSGAVKSTGLGLAFCKLAAEAHGGEIGVTSGLGDQTTFWFTLKTSTLEHTPPAQAKPIVNKEKQKEKTIAFNREELSILTPIVSKLEAFSVYETSDIEEIIDAIGTSKFESINRWVNGIRESMSTLNQKAFEALLRING